MANRNTQALPVTEPPAKASLNRNITAAEIESHIASLLSRNPETSAEIILSRNLGTHFFADTWASILIGSAVRHFSALDVLDWQKHNPTPGAYDEYVFTSVAALTAISLAANFLSLACTLIPLSREDV